MIRLRPIITSLLKGHRVCGLAALALGLLLGDAQAGTLFPAWRNLYDMNENAGRDRSQFSRGVAVDARGNVAVCGYIESPTGQDQLFVAKYSGLDGRNFEWARTFTAPTLNNNPSPGAYGTAVALDSLGNVIVTGYYQTDNSFDYLTIKLNGATGAPIWGLNQANQPTVVYNNNAAGGADQALKVIVDGADNVIVTGRSSGSGTQGDIYTVKYNGANGGFVWEHRYNSPANREDIPAAIAVDADNNVYVSGLADRSGTDSFYVTKLGSGSGAPLAGWPKLDANGGYGATGLAVDSARNVIVCGPAANGSNYDIKTIKYSSVGGVTWSRQEPTMTPANRWCGIGVDSDGNVSVVGTSAVESTGQRMYTVRYLANGDFAWDRYSPAPADSDDDKPQNLVVDGTSNTILIGESVSKDRDGNLVNGLYVATYSPIDGDVIDELYLTDLDPDFDNRIDSIDYTPQVAFDNLGGMALVANYKKPRSESGLIFTGYSAIKFNRLVLEKGDLVDSSGVEGKVASIGSPAVADDGTVAARVGISISKKKKVNAILTQGAAGAPALAAVQGADAPGGGKYQSFLDPLLSNNGRLAFVAKISDGSVAAFSTISGALAADLKTDQELPGLTGAKVKSISSIGINGISGNQLIGLVKISGELGGEKITKANDTVLVGVNTGGTTVLLRTGQDLTVDGEATTIKSITTLTAPKGSPGHGRWQNAFRVVARLLLADGRTAIASITEAGVVSTIAATGGDAGVVTSGAKWKTFGLPGTGTTGSSHFVSLGVLQDDGDVKADEDTAIVYGTSNALTQEVAIEGGAVPGVDDADYASFLDPVVNGNGQVAFLATIKGKKVKGNDKTVLMWGAPSAPELLVRTGDIAPDQGAFETEQKFTSITSFALPSGTGAAPIFLAKVAGKGASARNNQGLWGRDTFGKLRQLLRTGDSLGGRVVTKISLLQSLPSVSGATRSFNSSGSVLALVSFKGGNSGIYAIGIP
jgi:hypothetical protein